MSAKTEQLEILDDLLKQAISLLAYDARWTSPSNSEFRFEVSGMSDDRAQILMATNLTQDIKRIVEAPKSVFGMTTTAKIIGTLLDVEGESYRIKEIKPGADQVSYALMLGSPIE